MSERHEVVLLVNGEERMRCMTGLAPEEIRAVLTRMLNQFGPPPDNSIIVIRTPGRHIAFQWIGKANNA
jgi:hypothetical protein